MISNKQDLINWLNANQNQFIEMSDQIWAKPETPWREFFSSQLQADFLAGQGFRVVKDLIGMNTSFVAEWGSEKPVIAFIGEYDALPGLSQKKQPTQDPMVSGGPGHGCGHNLLGVAVLASTVAVKNWMQENKIKGTVRYYGTPAEEGGSAKAYMARDGVFKDVDTAITWHPDTANFPSKGSCVGVRGFRWRFHGVTSHAGGSPHLGRSALDAVELMDVGVNFLREHVTPDVRMHYVITKGGDAPNIVPAEAEVWYYLRAHLPADLDHLTARVQKVAAGAAMMTETRMEEVFISGTTCLLNNNYLADIEYQNMELVGPIQYTEEELDFARKINASFPPENIKSFYKEAAPYNKAVKQLVLQHKDEPIMGANFPALDEYFVGTGSTDAGDLSWVVPLSNLRVACWPVAAPGHSWACTASAGTSIGHKGMMHAAKIMALLGMDLYSDPKHIIKAREEFSLAEAEMPYVCPIPATKKPPRYEP